MSKPDAYLVRPDTANARLTRRVAGIDHEGQPVEQHVVEETALTLFLNGQEIVTMMTIGDYPECLAVGYLINQNMLTADDRITGVEMDKDKPHIFVATARRTNYEMKLKRRTLTSGCAQGTAFGDVMEKFDQADLPAEARLKTSWLYALTRTINTTPSLYLHAGAIHGCVLCEADRPLIYMEDVGRHNAVDKIAGYMRLNGITPQGKLFYTTGRLTSEMVIKTVQMQIPILISRSGFTASGVALARRADLTLVGRARGKRFVCLAGEHRIEFDARPDSGPDEAPHLRRKAAE